MSVQTATAINSGVVVRITNPGTRPVNVLVNRVTQTASFLYIEGIRAKADGSGVYGKPGSWVAANKNVTLMDSA